MSVRELTADLVVDARATLGEGARWDPQGRLYWVDITAPALHLYDPSADTDTVVPVDRYLGAVVLRDSGGDLQEYCLMLSSLRLYHLLWPATPQAPSKR